jgi:hypothetical protein
MEIVDEELGNQRRPIMIPMGAITAPRSYGKPKKLLFYVGAYCYLSSSVARKAFSGASEIVGQIGSALNPNYRYGEIREAITREVKPEEFKPKAVTSDLLPSEVLYQTGITEDMRKDLAWKYIEKDVTRGIFYNAFYSAVKLIGAATLSVFSWVFLSSPEAFEPSFYPATLGWGGVTGTTAAFLFGRSITDWIRSVKYRNIGFQYFLGNPFSKANLKTRIERAKKYWLPSWTMRCDKHLQRLDSELASSLKNNRGTN